jgi:anti-sigma factor RsiW
MNACNNLPLYLYNELDAESKKVFKEHLASCKECQRAAAAFKTLCANKKTLSAPQNVIDAIFEKTTRKRAPLIFSKSFKAAFALAACLLIAVFAVSSKKDPRANNFAYADVSIEEIINIDSELDEFEADFMFYI